jgi:zinc transport system substrate-binding protein
MVRTRVAQRSSFGYAVMGMRSILTSRWVDCSVALALGLGGCVAPGGASDGRPHVVASFYPLYEAAERVAGDLAEVTNLTPPGAEPHDVELATDDVDLIEDADVVLYVGQGFQPGVEESAERSAGVAVDVLEGLTLLRTDQGADPHVWLDPELMLAITHRAESALLEADPDDAVTYRRNAEAFGAELRGLDAQFEQGLSGCERDLIVVSHAAFGYLAAAYGLRQEAIAGLSPEAEADPARLDELARLVETEDVTTIFTETLVAPDLAETLAREVGVQTDVLNPIEGLTEEQEEAGQDYLSLQRENLAKLREALGCP